MTQTNALLDAHKDYIAQFDCPHCPEYVGRSVTPGPLFTEVDRGIAISERDDDGEPRHWFVADDVSENET